MAIIQQIREKPQGDVAAIKLTHGKWTTVDSFLYEELSQHKWKAQKSKSCWYAVRNVTINGIEKQLRMHRQIMKPREDEEVHHLNHNSLDNRIENLINCTHQQHKNFHHDFG